MPTTPYSALRYVNLADAANAQTLSQNLATDIDFQVIADFQNATARNAALSGLAVPAGTVCYLKDEKVYDTFNGTQWKRWQPRYNATLLTDITNAGANTTQVAATGLALAVEAGKLYRVWAMLRHTEGAGTNTDLKISWSGPTQATAGAPSWNVTDASGTNHNGTAGSLPWTSTSSTIITNVAPAIDNLFVTGFYAPTVAGTLQLFWGKAVGNAGTSTLFAGSTLELTDL